MKLIAEGTQLSEVIPLESEFAEGNKGEIRLYLDREMSDSELVALETSLLEQGVVLTDVVKQDARIVLISFQKAIAPLIIIGGIAIAGLLGWQLYKQVTEIDMTTMLLVGGGGLAAYLLLRNL